MMQAQFVFPDWLNEFVPADELFANAYQAMGDQRRAAMKTCIARLYDLYGPKKNIGRDTVIDWRGGFRSRAVVAPVDFSVTLFDGNLLSPARLLATLVPALAGGVKRVLAVRIADGSPWAEAVLTGLELAGQELVADMDEAQVRRLFADLRDSGANGAVTVLGPKAGAIKSIEIQAASRMSFWRPRFNRAAAVWMSDRSSFDLEVLAFMHPDVIFNVFGEDVFRPSENFNYMGDSYTDFIDSITDVAYVSSEHIDEALRHAKLVLGPGQEACWVWPDLYPEQFEYHSTALTSGV